MTEVQPAEGQTNGGGGGGGGGGAVVVAASTDQQIGTKRQRRPSVRLGDIGGDQSTYDSTHALNRSTSRSSNKPHWKQHRDKSSSKSRTSGGPVDFREILDKEPNLDTVAIGSWKVRDSSKSKRSSIPTTKRIRSNWVSKIDGNGQGEEEEEVGGEEEDVGDEFRVSDSESPVKDNSPVHSSDNNEREGGRFRRGISRARVLDGGVELDGPSDNDGRNWNNNSDVERNGVKVWLNQLGLGRYAPVFEIHEVDDEVLPMLTLEDLKDMGINAVGSRRKMYSSIQKLGKGFS